MSGMKNLYQNFKTPKKGYGEVSFFWWHGDKITKEKLLWILDQLKEHHISGLQINYAHSDTGGKIYGLTLESDPRPMSDEWWELFNWFLIECQKYDITLSLSDYTLGSPGQGFYMDEVIKTHPEFIGKMLEYIDGEVNVIEKPYSVDPMNKNLGQAVIDEFFGRFEENCPEQCGGGVNFFFSDELNFNISGNLWNDEFQEEFQERKGYDITPYLKAIFEDIGDITPKIRLDYYDVIVQLSEEGYFKPVYDWHEKRGMTFGCDHGGRGRNVVEFGDYFRTQRYNQAPGNDQPHLGSDIIKNKVSSSIAHLYKRPRTWLEGFYSSGYGTTSADVADATFRNFAMGHNLLSLHGLYYSTYGSMWEWAPPCNHYHMPYWQEMKAFLACTERLSYILSQGVHCCDVAIIYPVEPMQAGLNGEKSVDTAFKTAEFLYPQGVDFDFIDFESINRAEIKNKKLCVAGKDFRVLIIPSMEAMRFETIKKIEEFSQNGGIVINIGDIPIASDRSGRNDSVLNIVVSNIMKTAYKIRNVEEILVIIDNNFVRDFRTSSDSPYILHRVIEDKDLYMVYNVPKDAKCEFRATGTPRLLNAWTGEIEDINEFVQTENGTYITMPLTEKEVQLIIFDKIEQQKQNKPGVTTTIKVEGEWECEIKPTLDNKYGDYRLPAFDGFIGAEARQFKFKITNEHCVNVDDSNWEKTTYSYGTYLWKFEGKADEGKLIEMTQPTDDFVPYNFSMRMGIEGDAGNQSSYHGLKCKISNDFIALGTKRLKSPHSSSIYEGDNTYYIFTTVFAEKEVTANISIGELKPTKIWINHKLHKSDTVSLNKGHNYILLKFEQSGRTHFIIEKKNDFVQNMPLAMKWFNNPNVIPFDCFPNLDSIDCWYRFISPPALESMKITAVGDIVVYADDEQMKQDGNIFCIKNINKRASQIAIKIKQKRGVYGGSAIVEPIELNCKKGIIEIGDWSELDGLRSYSGGILYSKTMELSMANKIVLDMGIVVSTAKVWVNGKLAGVKVSQPFIMDITNFVIEGENKIEILVHNTIANHMTTIPTTYNGNTASGFIMDLGAL